MQTLPGAEKAVRRETRWIVLSAVVAATASAALVLCLSRRREQRGNQSVPAPNRTVDLNRYIGLWHELGRYDNEFERDCEFVTAEYRLRADGLVDVINTCRGPERSVRRVSTGRARVVAGTGNAKLKVSFFGPFFLGNYWILDHAEDYSWSIVGEPTGRYLWILGRNAPATAEQIDQLITRARGMGYDMSRFRLTRQV